MLRRKGFFERLHPRDLLRRLDTLVPVAPRYNGSIGSGDVSGIPVTLDESLDGTRRNVVAQRRVGCSHTPLNVHYANPSLRYRQREVPWCTRPECMQSASVQRWNVAERGEKFV